MNKQEIFDKVVLHARTQKIKATDKHGRCKYRTEDGLKCFIGALIPDDKYSPCLEGPIDSDITNIIEIEYSYQTIQFLTDLQIIHDRNFVYLWEKQFKLFAKKHGLTYNPPQINMI